MWKRLISRVNWCLYMFECYCCRGREIHVSMRFCFRFLISRERSRSLKYMSQATKHDLRVMIIIIIIIISHFRNLVLIWNVITAGRCKQTNVTGMDSFCLDFYRNELAVMKRLHIWLAKKVGTIVRASLSSLYEILLQQFQSGFSRTIRGGAQPDSW